MTQLYNSSQRKKWTFRDVKKLAHRVLSYYLIIMFRQRSKTMGVISKMSMGNKI
jgi:hypothetical protein